MGKRFVGKLTQKEKKKFPYSKAISLVDIITKLSCTDLRSLVLAYKAVNIHRFSVEKIYNADDCTHSLLTF